MTGLPVPAPDPGDRFRKPDPGDRFGKRAADGRIGEGVEVGEFRQGSPFSQWALARYLVGRAITESLGWSLLVVGVVLLALGGLAWGFAHSPALGVLLIVVAASVLILRAAVLGIVRRLTGFRHYGPLEERMQALVHDTSRDVLRELRRLGLPGRLWTLPLLLLRFLGRDRRRDTVARLRGFEVDRVVPRARLDELHLVVRDAFGSRVR